MSVGYVSLTSLLAAEQGTIEWGKLREVSRKASPETEALWLKLCGDLNYKQNEKLVAKTPKSGVPGDVFEDDDERATTKFRCRMSEEVFAMLDRARRMYSLEQDKAVITVEVLEWALASYISSQPVDEDSLEKVRLEMDKDLQAEKAREIPANTTSPMLLLSREWMAPSTAMLLRVTLIRMTKFSPARGRSRPKA